MTPEQKLTPEQHAELNAWIAENVMLWTRHISSPCCFTSDEHAVIVVASKFTPRCPHIRFQPTTSPADAAVVRKKCLERMAELYDDDRCIAIQFELLTAKYIVSETDVANGIRVEADTEELCWCLFARQLFTEDKR